MRGDSILRPHLQGAMNGSPPHAWGQPPVSPLKSDSPLVHPHMRGDSSCTSSGGRMRSRFTPTCVGTAGGSSRNARQCAVHPHMRGDSALRYVMLVLAVRFTPTCVGTAYSDPTSRGRWTVHPHMRGDSEVQPHSADAQHRFTPTCVGTACWCFRQSCSWAVHPHMRGDSTGKDVSIVVVHGSPPHAWGQRLHNDHLRYDGRFTPTCVGTASMVATSP